MVRRAQLHCIVLYALCNTGMPWKPFSLLSVLWCVHRGQPGLLSASVVVYRGDGLRETLNSPTWLPLFTESVLGWVE